MHRGRITDCQCRVGGLPGRSQDRRRTRWTPYLRPAPQPPIELEPLLQEMKTMFSVQPVSDVGSQPVSSPPVSLPPVSSPPTFNPLDNSNAVSRVRTRTARRKFLGRSDRPYRRRRLSASGCAARLGSSQSARRGAAIHATKPNAGNGISSKVQQPQPVQQVPQQHSHSQVQLQLQAPAALLRSCSRTSRPVDLRSVPLRRARCKRLMAS